MLFSPRSLLYPCRDQSAVSHSLAAPIALTLPLTLRSETELCTSSVRASGPNCTSGLHLHRGTRGAPRQGAGHCPCLDHMGQQQLHLLVPRRLEPSDPKVRPSSLPAHAALSTSAFTATLSLRHHHRHHRHRGLRASVGAVTATLSVTATPPPPTLPAWPPPPPSPPIWILPARCLCHHRHRRLRLPNSSPPRSPPSALRRPHHCHRLLQPPPPSPPPCRHRHHS